MRSKRNIQAECHCIRMDALHRNQCRTTNSIQQVSQLTKYQFA